MELVNPDTIFGLITPPGKGAVAVVRISGPKTLSILRVIALRYDDIISSPRLQVYTPVRGDEGILDYTLVTYFEENRSYTGEPSAEISLHASSFIIKSFLDNLVKLGARQSRAGEFTERAYLNGKLDLAQAEAVCDLINSETKAQAKASREQLEGRLSHAIDKLGEPLRDLLSEIEANIDFPEEEIDPKKPNEWVGILSKVSGELTTYIRSYEIGKILHDGALIVLAGVPNAGKSSLMNALLNEERAIVTSVPGTTRDSIEERIEIEGFLCRLVDTAGLASHDNAGRQIDEVEKIGIERSFNLIKKADLVLYLYDKTQNAESQISEFLKVKESNDNIIIVKTKADLVGSSVLHELSEYESIEISAKDSSSVDLLTTFIGQNFLKDRDNFPVIFTNQRHKDCLINALEGLNKSISSIKEQAHFELISFEIRAVLNTLSEIIGNTDTEDILGRIFSKFCIGK